GIVWFPVYRFIPPTVQIGLEPRGLYKDAVCRHVRQVRRVGIFLAETLMFLQVHIIEQRRCDKMAIVDGSRDNRAPFFTYLIDQLHVESNNIRMRGNVCRWRWPHFWHTF